MRMSWFTLKVALQLLTCYQIESAKFDPAQLYKIGRGGEHLIGKAEIHMYKKPLPGDITDLSNQKVDRVRCGEAYAISNEGYLIFKLNSKKPCLLQFMGSKVDQCTTAFYCDGKINIAPKTSKGCTNDYLLITDGLEGIVTGCGSFSFGRTPLISRNNGTDLNVYYKGDSRGSRCIAFCIEDLNDPGKKKMKEPRLLKQNKNYKGFKYDSSCVCGKRKNFGRIIGGKSAEKFEFPWIGALVPKHADYNRTPFCGGALINSRYFISAGHCFADASGANKDNIQVLLHSHIMAKNNGMTKNTPGYNLPTESDQSEKSVRLDVEKVIRHPLFSEETYDFDVSILKLKQPVDFGKSRVAPICLPNMGEGLDKTFRDGDILTVSGWGRPWEESVGGTRLLENLEVPFVNLPKCQNYNKATSRHLCAGFIEGGKDACAGDSGGPLITPLDKATNQYILAAVVSAGVGCARRNNLGLYTNTQELVHWIYRQTMEDSTWCKRK